MTKPKWECIPGISNNLVLHQEGFYISYASAVGLSGLGAFGSDDGGDETALCVNRNGKVEFYILRGDFREAYEKAAPQGLEACMKVFDKHKARRSDWSTGDDA